MTDTLLDWPGYAFPYQPLNDPFAFDAPDVQSRTPFEQGLSRQRRAYRRAMTVLHYQWAFDAEQYRLFKGWLRLVGGGLFNMPIFAGSDYVNAVCRFAKGSLKAVPQDGEWLVSADVETSDAIAADTAFDLVWPDGLPFAPLKAPLAHTLPDATLRADLDSNGPEQSSPFRNAATTLDYQIAFTLDQFVAFLAFARAMAGKRFTMQVLRDTAYVSASVQIVQGSLKPQRSGYDWIAAFQLETLDNLAPDTDAFAAELLTVGYDGSLDDLIAEFHQAVQYGLPGALA